MLLHRSNVFSVRNEIRYMFEGDSESRTVSIESKRLNSV